MLPLIGGLSSSSLCRLSSISTSYEDTSSCLFPYFNVNCGFFRKRLNFEEQDPISLSSVMQNVRQSLFLLWRSRGLHTISQDRPSESLKRKVLELQKKRKTRSTHKNDLYVEVPESMSFLDTSSMPLMLTAVGVALFAKLLMMYDESRSQELIERKIQNAPPGQGSVRMLTREEWEEIREVRPRTPFESKLARPNARIRTEQVLKKEDLKDWAVDVLMDAVTRVEESVKHN